MDKQSQTELALKACKIFSAGLIASLILEIYFASSQELVLFVFLTPLTFGFLMGLVTCPWLNTLKPLLFKIIVGAMFVVGALLGVAFILLTGGGMQ
jgi:hypothetical protein